MASSARQRRQSARARAVAAFVAAGLAAAVLGACDALVGGECSEGYVAVQGRCVPAGSPAGSAGWAGAGGSGANAGYGGGSAGSGGAAGSGGPGGSGGSAGTAGAAGSGGQGGGCAPPLVDCGGTCADLDSDFEHCGQCFRYCPTGLCVTGDCQGGLPGHLVVLGMDFANVLPPMRVLLGNAVFRTPNRPQNLPVRILDYRQHATSGAAANVDAALGSMATMLGRTYTVTTAATAAGLVSELAVDDFDVLLVHHQALAPAGELALTGASLHDPLEGFVTAGGVVVVLATGTGTAEMADLLTQAGILATTGFVGITGQTVFNQAPGDAIGLGVLSPFLSQPATSVLLTTETPSPSLIHVVTSASGSPVVIHKWR